MATRESTAATATATTADVAAAPPTYEKDNTMAMFIMAGMVFSSAGFTMYTKQADSLLRRLNRASKITQGTTKFPVRPKETTKTKSKLAGPDQYSKAKIFPRKMTSSKIL